MVGVEAVCDVGEVESVTLNCIPVVAAAVVGVPVMQPVDVLKLKPPGSDVPIEENVYAFTPPVTERQAL
jgi:hypothetical protein